MPKTNTFDFGETAPRAAPTTAAPRRPQQQSQTSPVAQWLIQFTATFLAVFLALTLFAVGVRLYVGYKLGQMADSIQQSIKGK